MGKLWYALPVVVALGLGMLFSKGSRDGSQCHAHGVGRSATAVLTGRAFRRFRRIGSPLADVKGPALINVWATWCISCVVEHPFLVQLSEQVPIYGLNYKDKNDAAQQWLVEKQDPYVLNWADQSGQLGLEFGVTGAPETYLVNAQGRIVLRHQGVVDERVWNQKFAEYFPGVTL